MDRIDLQVSRHRLEGIAEEMGEVLQRTAFSPNIKERRDFSCAITDSKGKLIAQAAHIPVHLGAIPSTMEAFLETTDVEPDQGYLLNDPYQGGTHLPDLSYIVPWVPDGTLRGYVINRAHHTDVGGETPGSMGTQTHVDEEGFRTGPRPVSRSHRLVEESVRDLLEASRTPDERITDLEAQVTAARRGIERLDDWRGEIAGTPAEVFDSLKAYSSTFMSSLLEELPDGRYGATDRLDDDGAGTKDVEISVDLTIDENSIEIDYTRSDDQVRGNVNCPRAVTVSATFYVLRSLLSEDIPVNQGILDPVDVVTRPGSILEVEYPGAVAGGNVETSQRVVDVLLDALREAMPGAIPADSQGTMNNLSFGLDPEDGPTRTYYETLGGGAGAGPRHEGLSCRQTHMTNTQNTPIEEFENHFPLVVTRLRRRRNSGGGGTHRGGDGLIKAWQARRPISFSLLTERRRNAPRGAGGEDGARGRNLLIRDGDETVLDGKCTGRLEPGAELVLKTPGGGGWNPREEP